ncbi:MAG TPA: HEAT repeat domain-containing protein [Gemmatimonadales bacterium]|jgi:HEAT repeat protein|nr:HEAT repeat domain-containing protein [Gemmatimonadales bacterium]
MLRLHLGLALAAIGTSHWWSPAPVEPVPLTVQTRSPDDVPPPPWRQGDPADSLYRAARETLGRRQFDSAAGLFGRLPSRYPKSAYAPDAYYWQAFALYRVGDDGSLRTALAALRTQQSKFPKAATQGDAAALERRIQGELARRGDPTAAVAVERAASAVAAPPPVPPVPPVTATAPVPPEAPEPPDGSDRDKHGKRGKDCEGDDDDIKIAAVNALIQMDSEKARPILQRILARKDAGSACLRQKAVFLIAQGGGEGAEDILLETTRTDPDPEVREQAVFWLSQVGTEKAVTALDSILRRSTDRQLQEKALFALSQHESPRARAALRTYAERSDVPDELREKAIFWIGQSDDPESGAYLRSLFGRVKSVELRKKLLFSVSQQDTKESRSWLLTVARDANQPMEIRKQALFSAGQAGVPSTELGTLYDGLTDRELKEQLLFVLSQQDDAAAVDKLLVVARKDPDTELRKKALFWLGQSDDPRAAKALQDIIEAP